MNEREQEALGRHLILSLMTAVLMTGLLIFVLKLFYTPVSAHAGQCKSSGECKAGEECVEGLCERLYCSVGEPCTMSCDCPEPNTCAGEPGKERCTPPPPPAPTCTEPQTAELIRQLRAVHADCLKKTGGKDAASCEPKDLEHFYRAHRDAERLFKESKSGVLVVFMFPTGKPEERDRQKPWVKEALPAYIEQVRALGLVTTLREASSVVMLARATPSKDQNADAKYASSRLWFAMEALEGRSIRRSTTRGSWRRSCNSRLDRRSCSRPKTWGITRECAGSSRQRTRRSSSERSRGRPTRRG